MANRKIFYDNEDNELEIESYSKNTFSITLGKKDGLPLYAGYIALGKEDAIELIKTLTEIEKDLEY